MPPQADDNDREFDSTEFPSLIRQHDPKTPLTIDTRDNSPERRKDMRELCHKVEAHSAVLADMRPRVKRTEETCAHLNKIVPDDLTKRLDNIEQGIAYRKGIERGRKQTIAVVTGGIGVIGGLIASWLGAGH